MNNNIPVTFPSNCYSLILIRQTISYKHLLRGNAAIIHVLLGTLQIIFNGVQCISYMNSSSRTLRKYYHKPNVNYYFDKLLDNKLVSDLK